MITRDNYEEFFLLYTDNELSAAERLEVERFIADHPDLREEWEAFLQCRLSPESLPAFPDRQSLLKPETGLSPYTEDLLSYIDDELDEGNKARIETLLLQHPSVARELTALRQTVSHPDPAVVFPEKDRLYRTEKDRRVIPMPWLRAGIAAAVAGAIAMLLLFPVRQQPDAPVAIVATIHHDSSVITNNIAPTVTSASASALHPIEGQPKTHRDRPERQIIERRDSQQLRDVAVDNPRDETPAALPSKIDPAIAPHDADPATTAAIGTVSPTQGLAADIHLAVETGIPKEHSFATQALLEEANDQRSNVFTADGSAAPGRTALRGIFRKVKRAFGKTAERDSDGNRQVLVGAFQVSLD